MLTEQLTKLYKYRDDWKLITQADKDGGDTANRTGALYVYLKFLNSEVDDRAKPIKEGLAYDLFELEKQSGRFVRHSDPSRWYSNINNFTRDQSILIQAALVMYDLKHTMFRIFKQRLKRMFFHFNTEEGDDRPETKKTKWPDPPAPIEFAQFIRGMECKWLYPLLWLLDLQLVIDVLIVRPITIKQGNKDFDSNYLPILIASLYKGKTMWGLLAKKIYKHTDAPNRIKSYFKEGPGHNGLAPLGEIAVMAFNKLGDNNVRT